MDEKKGPTFQAILSEIQQKIIRVLTLILLQVILPSIITSYSGGINRVSNIIYIRNVDGFPKLNLPRRIFTNLFPNA